MHPIRLAVAAAVLLAAATVGTADAVDAVVSLGVTHAGTVPAGGSPVVVGMLLPQGVASGAVTVKAAKGSLLVPQVSMALPDGTVRDADAFLALGATVKATPKSVAISKMPALAASGLYKFLVTGADGTEGGFTLVFKGKPSKGFKTPVTSLANSADKDNWILNAPENAIVTIALKPSKTTPYSPSLQILNAEGDVVNYSAFATLGKDESISVKNMPLRFFGDHTLRVGATSGFGDYTLSVKVKAGKPVPVVGAPTADAGGTFIAEPAAAASIDGSGTTGATGYQWVRVSGPSIALAGRTTATPTFTAPLSRGTWAWQLVGTNPAGPSLPSLAILEVDRAPIASAGPSRSVATGTPVTLDGSASLDMDAGDTLRHAWTQVSGPAATLDDPFAAQPTFTPGSAGTYSFRLVVDDGTAESPHDTVVVVAGGAGPASDAGRVVIVRPQDSVFLSGLRSVAADGGPPSSWAWTADAGNAASVTMAGADGPVASFTAPKTPMRLRFRLSADGGAADDVILVVTTAVPFNLSPVARAGNRQTVVQGAGFVLDGGGSTDDTSVAAHEWGQAGGADAGLVVTGSTASGTAPLADDVLRFWLAVHDGRKYGPPDQVVVVSGSQGAPLADAGTDRSGNGGQVISLTSGASIPAPGQTITGFQWTQLSGRDWYDVDLSDAGFDPTAASPQVTVPTGVSSLTSTRPLLFGLTVTDGAGTSVRDLITLSFTGLPKNASPSVDASTTASVFRPGASAVCTASATDNDGDPISYSWQQISGPAVTINPASLPQVSITVPTATGTIVLRVTANDGTGEPNATDTADVVFSVNQAPVVIVSADPQSGPANTVVTLNGSATADADDAVLTYAWTEIPPVSGGTVTLSGANTPTASFTQPAIPAASQANRRRTFRLTVTDSVGPSGATSATVNFAPNTSPVLDAIVPTGDRKVFYTNSGASSDRSETLTAGPATDPDGDTLTWSWRVVDGPDANSLQGGKQLSGVFSSTSARVVTFGAPKPSQSLDGTGGIYKLGVVGSDGAVLSDEVVIEVLVTASFAGDVYPMFQGSCVSGSCHGTFQAAGLRLDQGASQSRTNLLTTGDVSTNNYQSSDLYNQVNSGAMPKTGAPWSPFQVNMVWDWIEPEHNVTTKPGISGGAENN